VNEEKFEEAKVLLHRIKVLRNAVEVLENPHENLWPTIRILYEDGYDRYIDGMQQLLSELCTEMGHRAKKKLAELEKQFEELR
jgi:hypothetical protein